MDCLLPELAIRPVRSHTVPHRSRPVAAALAILILLGMTGSWHATDDDPDCQSPVTAHDHAAHRIQLRAAAARERGSHCAICHWLQSIRTGSVRQARIQFADLAANARVAAAVVHVRATELLDLPPRAPPA
jgi:hypothetical protein